MSFPGTGPNSNGGASLSDIFNAIQNLTKAISNVVQTLTANMGNITSVTVTSQTLVIAGTGRLVSATVVVAGTGAGTINNAATTGAAAAANALMATPTTVGVILAGHRYTSGLVITPGTGQSINVTYFPT